MSLAKFDRRHFLRNMAIKSMVSQAMEKVIRDRGINIPEDKKSKYSSLVRELEQKIDNSLAHAFDDLRDGVEKIGREIGIDFNSFRDKIVKEVRNEIPRDN